jgi:hypothetical protein
MTIDYAEVLTAKYPNAEWSLNGDTYEGLTWLSDTDKPTKKELDDFAAAIAKEKEAAKVQKESAKAALLERLGITAEEAALLLA